MGLERRRAVFVIRKGDWKLIKNCETQSVELYNLVTDISKKNDIANEESKIASSLLDELNKWLESTNAPTKLKKNPKYLNKN